MKPASPDPAGSAQAGSAQAGDGQAGDGQAGPAQADPGAPIPEYRDGDGHRERRDIASGQSRPDSAMVRFVVSPAGVVVPDILAKLPGRGAWVAADRASLEAAMERRAFNRAFKRQVEVPTDLPDQVAALLKRRLLGLISMARKGGRVAHGFVQVQSLARAQPLTWRIEARDGAPDGRASLRRLVKAVAHELHTPLPGVVGVFTSEEIGDALGRGPVVHAALGTGSLAKSFGIAARKLAGFEPLLPPEWPDLRHEQLVREAAQNGADWCDAPADIAPKSRSKRGEGKPSGAKPGGTSRPAKADRKADRKTDTKPGHKAGRKPKTKAKANNKSKINSKTDTKTHRSPKRNPKRNPKPKPAGASRASSRAPSRKPSRSSSRKPPSRPRTVERSGPRV